MRTNRASWHWVIPYLGRAHSRFIEAWPDAVGHAYAGGCQKGNEAALGWNWNVENPRQALVAIDGSYHLVSLGGADVETVLTAVARNRYRLRVLNTSGIGILNGFDWTPPPGSKIDSITGVYLK